MVLKLGQKKQASDPGQKNEKNFGDYFFIRKIKNMNNKQLQKIWNQMQKYFRKKAQIFKDILKYNAV